MNSTFTRPLKSWNVPEMENECGGLGIRFFIKSSVVELFGETGVLNSSESWVGRSATLPELHKENHYANDLLRKGFRGLVWLHEQGKGGERGRGLTAAVEFGPMGSDRRAPVLDVVFFQHTVGKVLLDKHKKDGTFLSCIGASRHSRVWPICDDDVNFLLAALREKSRKIAAHEKMIDPAHLR